MTGQIVPVVPFANVAGRVQRNWCPAEANPHHAAFAQTRGGKSHLIRWGILPLAALGRMVVIDVKPGGDRTWNGWGEDVTGLRPGFGLSATGLPRYRVRVLPGAEGSEQVRRILEQLAAEGEVIIVVDDAGRVTDNAGRGGMGLGGTVDHMLSLGAATGVTMILGLNSTAWAASGAKDQCGTIWIGVTRSRTMRDNFADVAGLPREVRPVLDRIPARHWLYSDYAGDDLMMALTHVPAAA